MNIFSERLTHAMEVRGVKAIDLSKMTGIGRSSISEWVNGKYEAKQDKIYILANALDVDAGWLTGLDVPMESNDRIQIIYNQLTPPRQHNVLNYAENQLDEQNGVINIDTIKEEPAEYITEGLYGRLSAGTGQQIFDNPVEDVKVPSAIIPDEPYDIMLKIVGDSMQPAFEDGEYVFIKLTKEIRSGQFAAIIVDDEAFLKKVYVEEDQMRLVSLNKNYEDIIVNEYSNIEVVGTVVL
ncbi:S24 family peptidase [Facklamia hominis]|uniref:HTH cro/C1-type domain-containing protein n=1 Tax=Facklamia hominis CCUG 36813 TaxID=883111 RepID=K1MEL1_9LACT|nr:S24 family peptidase [Facklamia hominis]EKB54509.1 hypothetical protein HMPREF9706_00699 [Facklamia hominis CCUG 36813]